MNPLVQASWPSEDVYFCIGIQCILGQPQRHALMLYRLEGKLMIGDLQTHLQTRRDEAACNPRIFWVAPNISIDEQKMLAAKLESWLTLNTNAIPYSVAHPGGVVFADDRWVGQEPAQGLTCATFIVELFNELAIPFLDKDSWEIRCGDREWAFHILTLLGMDDVRNQAQMALIGETVRIRPSDTFAAGSLITETMEDSLPFQVVSPLSESVENSLRAIANA